MSELGRDAPLGTTVIGEPVVLYRDRAGAAVAMHDRCCHRRARLSLGRIEGDRLRCMYHGLLFDPSGACIEIPGQDRIPPNACVRVFPVEERGSWLWVWMGDPALADPALIPPVRGSDDPDWDLRGGQMDYRANYELINDNLTDFSHLSFVHPNSFGASPHWAQVRPVVRRIDRGVRISRWITGGAAENRNVASVVGRSAQAPCTYISYDYLAPGVLIMRSETYRIEDLPEDGVSAPTGVPVGSSTTCQAVTPMTEDTTRYYFVAGVRRGAAGAEKMLEITRIAFEEDKAMIEAQAANIKLAGGGEIVTSADVGSVQFRSILRALIKAETKGVAEPVSASARAQPASLAVG